MDKETETASPEAQVTPGRLLKEKRVSLGLSIEQVADRLRLRATIVESLEADNFDIDKVATFTRGYLRSYARLVGVNEQLILSSFDQYSGLDKPDAVPMKSFSRKTTKEQHNSRINFLTFFIIVVVIGISSIWWYQNQQQDSLRPDTLSEQSSSVPTETLTNETQSASSATEDQTEAADDTDDQQPMAADAQADDAAVGATDTDKTTEGGDTNVTESQSTQTPQTDEAAVNSDSGSENDSAKPAQDSQSKLAMQFEKDCWIRVKDAKGKTLAVGLKKAGDRLNLEAETPISIVLGAPEGVSITFAGEPVDLSRYTSGKVARFTLP